jgi:hypothetical protein
MTVDYTLPCYFVRVADQVDGSISYLGSSKLKSPAMHGAPRAAELSNKVAKAIASCQHYDDVLKPLKRHRTGTVFK